MLNKALSEVRDLYSDIPSLIDLISFASGRESSDIQEELESHLCIRALFLLLGQLETSPNYPAARKRLARLLSRTEQDVEGLSRALAGVRTTVDGAVGEVRSGVNDLQYALRQKMYRQQGFRCAICGILLDEESAERLLSLSQSTLDHVTPYRLGGDDVRNLRLLCRLCNSVKQSRLHVGENGPIWTNNYVYWDRKRALAFWTIARDAACRTAGCGSGPSQARLFAVRRSDRGPWAFDNCMCVCEAHVEGFDALEY